jgi:hypothetical protein
MNALTTAADAEPTLVVAGDSLLWERDDIAADYPPADGYALVYRFAPANGGTPAQVAATNSGGTWRVAIPSATTAPWAVGEWRWTAVVSKDGGRVVVGQGAFKVDPDPMSASAPDTRSHARKVLAALEAAIEGRAASTDLKVTLADGRSIERLSHAELVKMRDLYAAKVAAEDRRRTGRGPSRLLARF